MIIWLSETAAYPFSRLIRGLTRVLFSNIGDKSDPLPAQAAEWEMHFPFCRRIICVLRAKVIVSFCLKFATPRAFCVQKFTITAAFPPFCLSVLRDEDEKKQTSRRGLLKDLYESLTQNSRDVNL